ncbi:hypothetical protein DFP72DRAFT_921394, partial [Ephemerocybe angulata]
MPDAGRQPPRTIRSEPGGDRPVRFVRGLQHPLPMAHEALSRRVFKSGPRASSLRALLARTCFSRGLLTIYQVPVAPTVVGGHPLSSSLTYASSPSRHGGTTILYHPQLHTDLRPLNSIASKAPSVPRCQTARAVCVRPPSRASSTIHPAHPSNAPFLLLQGDRIPQGHRSSHSVVPDGQSS